MSATTPAVPQPTPSNSNYPNLFHDPLTEFRNRARQERVDALSPELAEARRKAIERSR
jgi:hypothetical protein